MTSGDETTPAVLTGPGSGGRLGGAHWRGGSRWLGGAHWRGVAHRRSARQELALALVLGAAGAALIFLATRQAWAQVRTTPPRPLPASLVTVSGAALVPYVDALALAGLASLAAIVASRRLLRRLTGLLLAVLGASLAASVVSLSRTGAIAAAAANTGPGPAGAGSVTQGASSASSGVPNVAGASSHVTFIAGGWQALAVTGAIILVTAGILVLWRADRMAVMSGRYDAPSGAAKDAATGSRGRTGRRDRYDAQAGAGAVSPQARPGRPAGSDRVAEPAVDPAAMWDALSRGDDPTSAVARGDRNRTS